jgi:hypothetical protein
MIWILVFVLIILFLVFSFKNDYKENVRANVTMQGGMENKYRILINYLLSEPSSRILKLSDDSIVVSSPGYTFNIDYVGNNTEIALNAVLPVLGQFSNKWKYPDGYPQEKIIEEIENFLDWKITELKKIAESDPLKYINYKD